MYDADRSFQAFIRGDFHPTGWKSQWRIDLEKRMAEDQHKAQLRIVTAKQIQVRQSRRPDMPSVICDGCGKSMRSSTKTKKCHDCTRIRDRCACGKVIIVGNATGQCKECFKQANRPKCAMCDAKLNVGNKYGLCKPHYIKMRHVIHQEPMVKCSDPSCNVLIRPTNMAGACRIHSRKMYAKRAKAKDKAKRAELRMAA